MYLDGEGGEAPALIIDARTGAIESDTLSEKHADLTAAVEDTIKTNLPAPDVWPYSDENVPKALSYSAGVAFVLPPPDSGMLVAHVIGYCRTVPCDSHGLNVLTNVSMVQINADRGTVTSSNIDPADSAAFERFIASLVVLPATVAAGDSDHGDSMVSGGRRTRLLTASARCYAAGDVHVLLRD